MIQDPFKLFDQEFFKNNRIEKRIKTSWKKIMSRLLLETYMLVISLVNALINAYIIHFMRVV